MKIKKGAVLAGLDIRMRPVLLTLDKVYRKYGQEVVITCGLDGEHGAGSYHYYGLAVDSRINYFTEEVLASVVKDLKEALKSPYQVVLESNHIHIELDLSLI